VRTLHGLVQAVAEQQAVGQAGQRIVVRLVIQLIVRVPQFGDVREDADVMRHVTLRSLTALIVNDCRKAWPSFRRFQSSPCQRPQLPRVRHISIYTPRS
jgi:hypothetical protein